MRERRAEPRLLCSDLIRARVEGGEPVELTVNLEDISPSGASIQLEQEIAAGSRIRLQLGRHRFGGQVRYCIYREIGWFAGIRFDAGKKWSRELYEPQHLLDPRRVR